MGLDEELLEAAERGDAGMVRELLERGADMNAKDENGWTMLHHAAYANSLNAVRLLLERGADTSVKDDEGRTPLDIARERKHSEAARIIEEYSRMRNAPSILSVEHSSLYTGMWGRLLVRVKGAGLASLSVEGDVEWMDPSPLTLSGESAVEVPVKPKAIGELPVKITVWSESGKDVKIVWLKVFEKPETPQHAEHPGLEQNTAGSTEQN